jgi:hypothetical protein
MKRIYLHIGMHKTGTTSLQRLLASVAQQLRTDGALYPVCGRPNRRDDARFGHHLLAWGVLEKRGVNHLDDWHDVLNEIRTASEELVILSSEDFEGCNEEQIDQIKTLLKGNEVHIVVYLRNPVDHMVSAYKQRVKMGKYTRSFRAFVEQYIYLCDYGSLLGRWNKSFGAENVHVCIFDEWCKKEGLGACFFKLLGLPFDHYRSFLGKPENVSPTEAQVKAVRWLNILEQHSGGIATRPIHLVRRHVLRNTRLGRALVRLVGLLFKGDVFRSEDRIRIKMIVDAWNGDLPWEHVVSRQKTIAPLTENS